MADSFKSMCAELLSEAIYLGSVPSAFPPSPELVARARALLDQSVEEGPTDEDLWELYDDKLGQFGFAEDWPWIRNYVRAVLAKWGHQ
jgi:hypothetical protein